MTPDVPAICAAKRAALLAALRFVDDEAGILNGVPNEPRKLVNDPDVIAMELADVFGVPFDEDWPERVVAHLLKEQQP